MPRIKKTNNLASVSNFLFEVGSLRKLIRSHSQTLYLNDPSDNIASHSFRVCVIGYFLARLEKVDSGKVVTMCMFHDIPEARSGDQNWVHKRYVHVEENQIIKEQLDPLPGSSDIKSLVSEYQKRQTKESQVAKDADLIDQILLLKEHTMAGNNEAATWLKGKKSGQYKLLKTKNGKKLAIQIFKTNPSDWWENLWTHQRK